MIKKVLGIHYKLFLFFFVLGASITFALGRYIQFHSTGNDFWNILYYGRNMTISQPESLYNGFYPFGYAFVIGQMPFTYILPIAYIINSLLAGLFSASVSTLIFYTRNFFSVLIAFFGSVAAPVVFQSVHTIGPDIGAAAFVSFAVFLLWKNDFEIMNPFPLGSRVREVDDLHAILIGTFLGLGFLTRTHAIVSAIAIFIGYFILIGIRPFRPRLIMLGTFSIFVLLQVIVNLVSGHSAFETAQAFNVYKFLYGVDWTYPPTPAELEKFSLIHEITKNPQTFLNAYWIPFKFLASYSLIPAVCFLLLPKGKFSRYALFSFIYIILYSIPIAIGDSARAPLMVMGVYVPCMALIPVVLSELFEKHFSKSRLKDIVIGTLFIALNMKTFQGWILYDADFIQDKTAERKTLTVIEYTLLAEGMKSSTEIFADRYAVYTPTTMPYRVRHIERWTEDWFWGVKDEYPPLPNDSWESFSNACKEQGIRFLILSPNSFYRGEFFPLIYHNQVDIEELGLRFIGQRGNMRLYEIK